jgi:hypothetical protein
MATHALVEPLNNSLAALIGLSLKSHGLPVAAEFWLHSGETGQIKLAIVTPLVDKQGVREAYSQFFDALKDETFSTQLKLRTILFAVGEKEATPALEALNTGRLRLPQLGPYEDVDIFPVPDASEVRITGFLHLSPIKEQNLWRLSFAPTQTDGPAKHLARNRNDVESLAKHIPKTPSQERELAETMDHNQTTSILVSVDLKTLYDLHLV